MAELTVRMRDLISTINCFGVEKEVHVESVRLFVLIKK